MELHGTFPWKMSMQKFPWNSMEIGVLMFSMEFHGKCPNPPCKYFPWKSMEKFPWNSMEIDVLILHGIPWRIFWISMEFRGGFSHGLVDIFLFWKDRKTLSTIIIHICHTVSKHFFDFTEIQRV